MPTGNKFSYDELSDGEHSDDGLEIVIESPDPKYKVKTVNDVPLTDEEIIESVKDEIDKVLEEKAAKSNLTVNNVKNILKHVVTNEHVLAMVKSAEDEKSTENVTVFEPKLTRAKAKELFSSQPVIPLPWVSPKPPSEVHVLISEELQEDSSGDEYVPAEEESEDDRDGSFISESDLSSVQPLTPTNCDSSTQTNWSEDGLFKIPHIKSKEEEEEEANIARRTRSKLSLSSTPLEVIEEAFIPPDITTDMYDLDCDDDDWKDFLKKFTRPLDEVTKSGEDEDHDPEYNILADEKINKVDREELRADKAVKVTRKELNELIAELFEFADIYSNNLSQNKLSLENEPHYTVVNNSNDCTDSVNKEIEVIKPVELSNTSESNTDSFSYIITNEQILLLQQQLCQHVQLLTQTFMLTYRHPEFAEFSIKCKENLLNFKYLICAKSRCFFNVHNLKMALEMVNNWENKFETNDEEVQTTLGHVAQVLHLVKESKMAGTQYIPTFPKLILETVSRSSVFMYPSLLPRIPYKPTSVISQEKYFLLSEDELMAIGLEQFVPYLEKNAHYLVNQKQTNLKAVAHFLAKYILVTKESSKLYKHLIRLKNVKNEMNPIKYYFENKRAPPTTHYVIALESYKIMPPCEQNLDVLPYQWKEYLKPKTSDAMRQQTQGIDVGEANTIIYSNPNPAIRIIDNNPLLSKFRKIRPKPSLGSSSSKNLNGITPKRKRVYKPCNVNSTGFKKKLDYYFKSPTQQKLLNSIRLSNLKDFKFNSHIFKRIENISKNLFLNMPLLNTPDKNMKDHEKESASSTSSCLDDVQNLEKDNPEDINAFMVASSTMKNVCKREPSGAEKKRAKLRKEFTANLAMLGPEDPVFLEEKSNSYAQAYYDRLRECMDVDDYHKLIEVLNDHNENVDTTVQLYKQVETILSKKYPDLLEEFLTFLTPTDAKVLNKLVLHSQFGKMSLFLRKLEIYFKDQPAQVRKIYHILTESLNCVNVNMENIKKAVLPLLKGNSLLFDWFLQIFSNEKPPEGLLNGTWENVDLPRNINDNHDSNTFETITVPDTEDPFGGINCSCSCHNVEEPTYKSRSRHCVSCGTKFYQGRVYLQTGKFLRLAKVTFENGTSADHLTRLNYKSEVKQKRNASSSPVKQLSSPSKENQYEIHNNDSEEDGECCKKKTPKSTKTPKKSNIKVREKNAKNKTKSAMSEGEREKKIKRVEEPENRKGETSKPVDKQNIMLSKQSDHFISSFINDEKLDETNLETVELKLSPDHSADSGSEFCEESSQDNINFESDVSNEESYSLSNSPPHSENSNSNNTFEEISWTRDEDKVILETFQREPDKDKAFRCIAEMLENRSVPQITQRFQTLMSLLQQMVANSND